MKQTKTLMSDVLALILDEGIRGAGMIQLLVVAYKLYRMKIVTEADSDSCKCLKLHVATENNGGPHMTEII